MARIDQIFELRPCTACRRSHRHITIEIEFAARQEITPYDIIREIFRLCILIRILTEK